MPSIAVHLAITLFILAVFMDYIDRKDLKYLLALLLFGILPDIDIFVFAETLHRALLHNIFIVIAPLILLGIGRIFRIKRIRKGEKYILLACALLTLHICLDIFWGGVFLLYPLYNQGVASEYSLEFVQKQLEAAGPENIAEMPENISQTPENVSEITNITGPPPHTTSPAPNLTPTPDSTPIIKQSPSPSPSPSPETYYGIEMETELTKTGNVSETHFIIMPTESHQRIPLINQGVELIFLITAGLSCVYKALRPACKK